MLRVLYTPPTVCWQLWQAATHFLCKWPNFLCHKSDNTDKAAQLTVQYRGRRYLNCQHGSLSHNNWFEMQKGKRRTKISHLICKIHRKYATPQFIHSNCFWYLAQIGDHWSISTLPPTSSSSMAVCFAKLSFTFLVFSVSRFSTELADEITQVPEKARKCVFNYGEAKLKSRAEMYWYITSQGKV